MADRPIIFSAPMVRALLDGRKTQTRRILKPQPIQFETSDGLAPVGLLHVKGEGVPRVTIGRVITAQEVRYAAGDRLWVRETCRAEELDTGLDGVRYAADEAFVAIQNTRSAADAWQDLRSYRQQVARRVRIGLPVPSIHMPRWASRLTLDVTEVRIQRLRDINEADAVAEGATSRPRCSGFRDLYDGWCMDWSRVGHASRWARRDATLAESDISHGSAVAAFAGFINGLHDPRWNHKGDGIFGANPWVAAISFTVQRGNIDALSMEKAA